MICIYSENYPDQIKPTFGRCLTVKAEWLETSAENLRTALLAIEHAPLLRPSVGKLVMEIDGVIVDLTRLPATGPDLLKRCSHWLYGFRWTQSRSSVPRPMFGL